jgi:DNA-binding winged helix-turn-helix (wHTH) protein
MLYVFGSCRLDMDRRQLLRDGVDRPLPPKALALLRVLIDARPRVVTKEELMDLVWQDTFVAEANVAILIGDIRAAIGDSAREPRFIKTHFRVGYSFCGEVTELTRREAVPMRGPLYILHSGERRIVLAGEQLTVGRDPDCDVVLPDPSVSRTHARIFISDGRIELEDLDSKNGTRVSGRRVRTRVSLGDGSEVLFGSVFTRISAEHSPDLSTLTVADSGAH